MGIELAANRENTLEPLVHLLSVDPARIRHQRLGALARGGFARAETETVEDVHEGKTLDIVG